MCATFPLFIDDAWKQGKKDDENGDGNAALQQLPPPTINHFSRQTSQPGATKNRIQLETLRIFALAYVFLLSSSFLVYILSG